MICDSPLRRYESGDRPRGSELAFCQRISGKKARIPKGMSNDPLFDWMQVKALLFVEAAETAYVDVHY